MPPCSSCPRARFSSRRHCRPIWRRSAGELRGGLAALAAAAAGLPRRGACGAEVVHVVRIFDQPLVEVVADLLARGTDEVDALDRLVDPLAVQDPALELLDA